MSLLPFFRSSVLSVLFCILSVYAPSNILRSQQLSENFEGVVVAGTFVPSAFNLGIVPQWIATTGTPSICRGVQLNPTTFACIGTATGGSGQCWEGIAGTLSAPLVVGRSYTISFTARAFSLTAGTIPTVTISAGLGMLAGMSNTTCNPAPVINGNGQLIRTQVVTGGWANYSLNFVATAAATQIHFIIGNVNFNLGIDNICLFTAGLNPRIALAYGGGGNYTFTLPQDGGNIGLTTFSISWGDGTPNTIVNAPFPNPLSVQHNYTTAGTYTSTIVYNNNPTCLIATTTVVYDPCSCSAPTNYLPAGIYDWTNVLRILEGDVILLPGAHLKVDNSTVQIATNCRFVVARGASMQVVNQSLLTSLCPNTRWSGVEVWGSRGIKHDDLFNSGKIADPRLLGPNDPAIFKINSNSTIRRMNRNCIQAQPSWSSKDQKSWKITYPFLNDKNTSNSGGGVIIADDANFSDNRLSAELLDYPFTNRSEFSNCRFTTNPLDNLGFEGVNLWKTDGVQFDKCIFSAIPSRAITALDAGITVTRSTFTQMRQAIALGSIILPLAYTKIELDNIFNNNEFGVWSDGVSQLEVARNQFYNNLTAGVHIGRATTDSRFRIRSNTFQQSTLSNNCIGISLENTGLQAFNQDVYCNKHYLDRVGLSVSGDCSGLIFKQNDYNLTKDADVRIRALGQNIGKVYNPQQNANNLFSPGSGSEMVTIGATETFRYIHTLTQDPDLNDRLTPDCALNVGGCTTLYNFNDYIKIFPLAGCPEQSPPSTQLCSTVDAVKELWEAYQALLLNSQNAGDTTSIADLNDAVASLNRCVEATMSALAKESDWSSVAEIADFTNRNQEKYRYLSLLVQYAEYTKARALVHVWKTTVQPEEVVIFADMQTMYLDFLQSEEVRFYPNEEQVQMLTTLGEQFEPLSSQARSLLYLLTSEVVMPDFTEISEGAQVEGAQVEDRMEGAHGVNEFMISPSPASSFIDVTRKDGSHNQFSISNLLGLEVKTGNLLSSQDRVDLPDQLPSGLYFFKYRPQNGKTLVIPFVIAR
jgi:Right handed beta helix region